MCLHHDKHLFTDSNISAESLREREDSRALLRQVARGDDAAFWKLWEQHRRYLYGVCLRQMKGCHADAEDALSRAMIRAWERLPEHAERVCNAKAWLVRLTRNLCIDIHRERARHCEFVESLEELDVAAALLPVSVPTPEDDAIEQERGVYLRSLIEGLSPNLRAPFIMRFVHELTYSEIAVRLMLSNENARKRVQQARAVLQDGWKQYQADILQQRMAGAA